MSIEPIIRTKKTVEWIDFVRPENIWQYSFFCTIGQIALETFRWMCQKAEGNTVVNAFLSNNVGVINLHHVYPLSGHEWQRDLWYRFAQILLSKWSEGGEVADWKKKHGIDLMSKSVLPVRYYSPRPIVGGKGLAYTITDLLTLHGRHFHESYNSCHPNAKMITACSFGVERGQWCFRFHYSYEEDRKRIVTDHFAPLCSWNVDFHQRDDELLFDFVYRVRNEMETRVEKP
jgi:hypothetical protein